jgi:hypothetical protein
MADASGAASPPAVSTNAPAPVRQINSNVLRQLGGELSTLFTSIRATAASRS